MNRIVQSAGADVLIMGHTRLPYVKEVDAVLFVTDGSAGKPKPGDPRAVCPKLEVGGELGAILRRVPCEVSVAAAAVRDAGKQRLDVSLLARIETCQARVTGSDE